MGQARSAHPPLMGDGRQRKGGLGLASCALCVAQIWSLVTFMIFVAWMIATLAFKRNAPLKRLLGHPQPPPVHARHAYRAWDVVQRESVVYRPTNPFNASAWAPVTQNILHQREQLGSMGHEDELAGVSSGWIENSDFARKWNQKVFGDYLDGFPEAWGRFEREVLEKGARGSQWDFQRLYEVFVPHYVCPSMQRVGGLGDGGKWLCGGGTLLDVRECVVYSFGSDNETRFEEMLAKTTGCIVHIFDPYVSHDVKKRLTRLHHQIRYHDVGLGKRTGSWIENSDVMKFKTLYDIMEELKHVRLDVLKIDIEGTEHAVFEGLFQKDPFGGGELPFGQILVEVHAQGNPAKVAWLFLQLMQRRFRMFSIEVNFAGSPAWEHVEVAFIHVDEFGRVGLRD